MWLAFVIIVLTLALLLAVITDVLGWAFRNYPRITWSLACGVVAPALIAHVLGYKVYGSPVFYDNRPILKAPRPIRSFAAPNIVVTADGARFEVKGMAFSDDLLEMQASDLPSYLYQDPGDILIEADPVVPGGVVFQRRNRYSCGCTFWPRWLPERLPKYGRADLGKMLAIRGLASRNEEISNSTNPPTK